MGRPAVILVMCGSSVATTNLAAVKLENEAKRRKVKIETRKGKIADFDTLVERHKPDLVVATATVETPKELVSAANRAIRKARITP